MLYRLFLITILFLIPSVCFGVSFNDIPGQFSYPEEIDVTSLPDGTEPLLVVRDGRPSIVIAPMDKTVVIGEHAYIFKKKQSGLIMNYVSDGKPSVFDMPWDSRYTSDDGYTIGAVTADEPLSEYLFPSDIKYIYRKSKTDRGYTYKRLDVGESELLLILKNRGELVKKPEKQIGELTVVGSIEINNLYGYIIKGDGVLPGCLNQKKEEYTLTVCHEPVEKLLSREIVPVVRETVESIKDKEEEKDKKKNDNDKVIENKPTGTGGNISPLKEKIYLNFKDTPLRDALISLSSQTGINITLDRNLEPNLAISAFYNGLSVEDALNSIISGLDITYRKEKDIYTITPFEEKLFDVNKVIPAESGQTQSATSPATPAPGPATGGNPPTGTPAGASGAQQLPASTVPVTAAGSSAVTDEGVNAIIDSIRKILSPQGIVAYLSSGFIYVKDRPSRLRAVESVLKMDNSKREEIRLKITLLRIDYRKEYETGINWSALLGGAKNSSPVKIDTGVNFLGNLTGDSNVSFIKFTNSADTISTVIKALSAYGDVSIVHTWQTRAMSGVTLPFELVQDVWYNGGTTVQVINNQTITSQQISKETVGLKITVNPVLQTDGRYLVNTAINISNVVGFQKVGDQELPQTEKNSVTVPIKMSKDDTVAISGFKIKNKDSSFEGVPFLSGIPILKHIFGHTKTTEKTSELSILISIESDDSKHQ